MSTLPNIPQLKTIRPVSIAPYVSQAATGVAIGLQFMKDREKKQKLVDAVNSKYKAATNEELGFTIDDDDEKIASAWGGMSLVDSITDVAEKNRDPRYDKASLYKHIPMAPKESQKVFYTDAMKSISEFGKENRVEQRKDEDITAASSELDKVTSAINKMPPNASPTEYSMAILNSGADMGAISKSPAIMDYLKRLGEKDSSGSTNAYLGFKEAEAKRDTAESDVKRINTEYDNYQTAVKNAEKYLADNKGKDTFNASEYNSIVGLINTAVDNFNRTNQALSISSKGMPSYEKYVKRSSDNSLIVLPKYKEASVSVSPSTASGPVDSGSSKINSSRPVYPENSDSTLDLKYSSKWDSVPSSKRPVGTAGMKWDSLPAKQRNDVISMWKKSGTF